MIGPCHLSRKALTRVRKTKKLRNSRLAHLFFQMTIDKTWISRLYIQTFDTEILRILEEEKEKANVDTDITVLVPELMEDSDPEIFAEVSGSRRKGFELRLNNSSFGLANQIRHSLSHLTPFSFYSNSPKIVKNVYDSLMDSPLRIICYKEKGCKYMFL